MDSRYKTVGSFTYNFPDKENSDCTVFIKYFGESKIEGIGKRGYYILSEETENGYIILNDLFKMIEVPKELCRKIPWYI